MAHAMLNTLRFPDHKPKGRFPVLDDRGGVVALISAAWTGTSFTATDRDERPLCAGSTSWWGMSGKWQATGADSGPLMLVRTGILRARASVRLERGDVFEVHGSAWRRDFTVTDADGQTVLTALPQTSAFSFRPYDYAVEQQTPAFQLAEIVALVQIWRMVRKAEASAAAAGTIAATGAATMGGA
jgi:hypothetical protein